MRVPAELTPSPRRPRWTARELMLLALSSLLILSPVGALAYTLLQPSITIAQTAPDLQVSKVATSLGGLDIASVAPGTEFYYEMRVQTSSAEPVNITLLDSFPSAVQALTITDRAGGTCTLTGNQLSCAMVTSSASAASVLVRTRASTTAANGTQVRNTVLVTAGATSARGTSNLTIAGPANQPSATIAAITATTAPPTDTPGPTNTPAPTDTPAPTNTPVPTNTTPAEPTATDTSAPTNTAEPTSTTPTTAVPTATATPSEPTATLRADSATATSAALTAQPVTTVPATATPEPATATATSAPATETATEEATVVAQGTQGPTTQPPTATTAPVEPTAIPPTVVPATLVPTLTTPNTSAPTQAPAPVSPPVAGGGDTNVPPPPPSGGKEPPPTSPEVTGRTLPATSGEQWLWLAPLAGLVLLLHTVRMRRARVS